jgi:hypothetical protein
MAPRRFGDHEERTGEAPRRVPQHARPGVEPDDAGAALEELASDDARPGTPVADDLAGQGPGDGLHQVVDRHRIRRASSVVLVRRRVEELHRSGPYAVSKLARAAPYEILPRSRVRIPGHGPFALARQKVVTDA